MAEGMMRLTWPRKREAAAAAAAAEALRSPSMEPQGTHMMETQLRSELRACKDGLEALMRCELRVLRENLEGLTRSLRSEMNERKEEMAQMEKAWRGAVDEEAMVRRATAIHLETRIS